LLIGMTFRHLINLNEERDREIIRTVPDNGNSHHEAVE
jgi:hypothetical protein